jgi:large subunit ribosomal protein L15
MQLHTISAPKNNTAKRVGRGGKRGTYSGRGIKGQRARAGRRIRPQLRDIIKKIPKKRGYRFTAFRVRPRGVNVSVLDTVFQTGDSITPQTLVERGVVSTRGGSLPTVKILGNGKLTKKLIVEGCALSVSAKEKIENVGGSIKSVTRNL